MPPFPLTFQQLPGSNYPTNGAERRGKDWRDVDSGSEICRRCGTGDDDPTRAGIELEGVQRCMCEERNGSELGQNKAVMVMQGDDGDREAVNIGDERVDVVQSFQYLGRIFSEDGGDMKELRPKMCNGEG